VADVCKHSPLECDRSVFLWSLRRWTVMPHGGHFAAMEQPAALADDIRVFFRPLRAVAGSATPRTRGERQAREQRWGITHKLLLL
jgi:hypothetical protein